MVVRVVVATETGAPPEAPTWLYSAVEVLLQLPLTELRLIFSEPYEQMDETVGES